MNGTKNKKGLQKELRENSQYQKMDIETLEVLSVVMDAPRIWEERTKYIKVVQEKEEYDMCQALREWIEDAMSEGRCEGRSEGIEFGEAKKTKTIVKNMLLRGMSDEDICALAECEQEFVDGVRAGL